MGFADIVLSWIRARYPTADDASRALARAQACQDCDERIISPLFGETCRACGCPLSKKLFTSKGPAGCPRNRWSV